MKILMTGASGFIGQKLVHLLIDEGFDQLVLVTRKKENLEKLFPFPLEIVEMDLNRDLPPSSVLEGIDAIIHLSGESIASQHWTNEKKKKIYDSRIRSTDNLLKGIEIAKTKPKVFICASAIGIYGDRGDETLTEDSAIRNDQFLSKVCHDWEKGLYSFKDQSIRFVSIRTGIVLEKSGGALAQMLLPFRLGVGGKLGNGKQWMSWIHLNDLCRLFIFALKNEKIKGPLNGVAPHPCQNDLFTTTLGKVLKRPTLFGVPKQALKIILGELSALLLDSQRVIPQKALNHSFEFQYPHLSDALQNICTQLDTIHFQHDQWVNKSPEEVFKFFTHAKNLEKLTPSHLDFKVLEPSPEIIHKDIIINYGFKLYGLPIKWKSKIIDFEPSKLFSDLQLRGPYSYWFHRHYFKKFKEGTLISDQVQYKIPGSLLGKLFLSAFIKKDIQSIFNYRKKSILKFLN